MPYCPKCKIEFLSGIETCSECGSALVDKLPEGEDILVPDWEAMDDKERSLNAHREAAQLRNAASTVYIKKADKYEDLRSTAICFISLGFLGLIFSILNITGILSFYRSPVQLTAMILIFIIFTAVGISAYFRSKEVKGLISTEEDLTIKINQWLEQTITKDFLNQLTDPTISAEANFLQESEHIRKLLQTEFQVEDDSYLDSLIDEFFNQHQELQ